MFEKSLSAKVKSCGVTSMHTTGSDTIEKAADPHGCVSRSCKMFEFVEINMKGFQSRH